MRSKLIPSVGLALAMATGLATTANAVSSTFNTGVEGWTTGNMDNPAEARLIPTFDPGGFITTGDTAGEVGFFAPASYLGNQSSLYNSTISFLLRDTVPADATVYTAVVLYGNNGQRIGISSVNPGASFTNYSFNLSEAGWTFYTGGGFAFGGAVTSAQFLAILADLEEVVIHADWSTGSDNTSLDNVQFGPTSVAETPIPGALPLFATGLAGLGFLAHRRKRKQAA